MHATKSSSATCKRNKPTGVIKYSDWQFPDTLNPVQSKLLVTSEIDAGILDGLFIYSDRGALTPVIAAFVPTGANGGVTDGGRTVTIHLRHGARWSDGSEITSRDLQFSLAVGKDPASGPYCKHTCDVIAHIDAPSRYVAVLRLRRPYAPILAYGLPVLWPYRWRNVWNGNPHKAANVLWNDTSFNFEGPDYPTNGPYQVAPGGFKDHSNIVLRPMRYYSTLTCGARLDTLVFTYFESKFDMITAAVKHKTDITQDYTLADAAALTKHTRALHVRQQPAYSFEHLEFNVDRTYKSKPNPLANRDVRAALALAIDKPQLAQSALGISPREASAITAWSPLISMPGLVQPFADTHLRGQWDPIVHSYITSTGKGRALADAKKLLARSPFRSGFTVDFLTILGNTVRQAQEGVLAQAWARLKVRVAPQYLSAASLFGDWTSGGALAHGQFQVAMYGSTTSPDPDELKFNLQGKYCDRTSSTHPDLNGNYSCIHDSVIDRALDTGADSLKDQQRAASYARFQQRLNQMAYWVPLYYRPQLTTTDGRVINFKPNPTQATSEWNMAEWRVHS